MNTRKGELAEWLRSGLQIRRHESPKSTTIQQHGPDFRRWQTCEKARNMPGTCETAPCLRRAAPVALFALCARFVHDSGAFQRVSRAVILGYAKKPQRIGGVYHG